MAALTREHLGRYNSNETQAGKAEEETERDPGSDNDMTHLAQDTARRPLYTINIINPFPLTPETPGKSSIFYVFGD